MGPAYLPIEEHGVIGDLRTVALVGTDGTIDWYCPARFDGPSLFGALLDAQRGGSFRLACRTPARPKQLYLPDSNILLTRFLAAEAVGEVVDFMVPETSGIAAPRDLLIRQARAVRGRSTFELSCRPAFDYGRAPHTVEVVNGVGAVFVSPVGHCILRTSASLRLDGSGGVEATLSIEEGTSVDFMLEWNGEVRPLVTGETQELFDRTADFWER